MSLGLRIPSGAAKAPKESNAWVGCHDSARSSIQVFSCYLSASRARARSRLSLRTSTWLPRWPRDGGLGRNASYSLNPSFIRSSGECAFARLSMPPRTSSSASPKMFLRYCLANVGVQRTFSTRARNPPGISTAGIRRPSNSTSIAPFGSNALLGSAIAWSSVRAVSGLYPGRSATTAPYSASTGAWWIAMLRKASFIGASHVRQCGGDQDAQSGDRQTRAATAPVREIAARISPAVLSRNTNDETAVECRHGLGVTAAVVLTDDRRWLGSSSTRGRALRCLRSRCWVDCIMNTRWRQALRERRWVSAEFDTTRIIAEDSHECVIAAGQTAPHADN